jgi:hypothetical protein
VPTRWHRFCSFRFCPITQRDLRFPCGAQHLTPLASFWQSTASESKENRRNCAQVVICDGRGLYPGSMPRRKVWMVFLGVCLLPCFARVVRIPIKKKSLPPTNRSRMNETVFAVVPPPGIIRWGFSKMTIPSCSGRKTPRQKKLDGTPGRSLAQIERR